MTVDELLTPADVSAILHVPTKTLIQWRYLSKTSGQQIGPKGARVGKHIRYRKCDVAAFIEDTFAR
jgi:hypothetical protein